MIISYIETPMNFITQKEVVAEGTIAYYVKDIDNTLTAIPKMDVIATIQQSSDDKPLNIITFLKKYGEFIIDVNFKRLDEINN